MNVTVCSRLLRSSLCLNTYKNGKKMWDFGEILLTIHPLQSLPRKEARRWLGIRKLHRTWTSVLSSRRKTRLDDESFNPTTTCTHAHHTYRHRKKWKILCVIATLNGTILCCSLVRNKCVMFRSVQYCTWCMFVSLGCIVLLRYSIPVIGTCADSTLLLVWDIEIRSSRATSEVNVNARARSVLHRAMCACSKCECWLIGFRFTLWKEKEFDISCSCAAFPVI